MLTISQATSAADIAAVRELLREYADWAFTLVADSRQAPAWEGFDEELAALPGVYAPPAGRLLLAQHAGQPAGCVCLKGHAAATSELKRLYVRPSFRGHNIGQQLVNRLVAEARQSRYQRIVLDSHISMTTAHALYLAAGFRLASAPADFPKWLRPSVVFMECDLAAGR